MLGGSWGSAPNPGKGANPFTIPIIRGYKAKPEVSTLALQQQKGNFLENFSQIVYLIFD